LLQSVGGKATAAGIGDAIAPAEVVVIATPYGAVEELIKSYGAAMNDKIVVDTTNKFGAPVVNNIQTIQAHAPRANIFRAFNSLGWENFEHPTIGGTQVDLFYCGADDAARPKVEQLIADVGLRPVFAGGLDHAALVDAVGSLWVALAFGRGMGRRVAFKVLEE
jgi:predicted dinucleotide-binding enzyme